MTAFLSSIVESLSGDASTSSDNDGANVTNFDSIEEVESLLDYGKRLLLGDEPLHILVEVVGATGLIHPSLGSKGRGSGRNLLQDASETSIADTSVAAQEAENANSSSTAKLVNAYVTINFQNRVIHATKTIKQDNNPIWDVSTRSVFIFQPIASEWLSDTTTANSDSNKLTILVCHETTGIKGDKVIGRISLDPYTVLTYCNEQRVELELEDAPTVGSTSSSKFSFRQTCRRATLLKSKVSSSSLASTITGGGSSRSSSAFHNFYSDDDCGVPPCGTIALRFRLATSFDLQFLRRLNSSYNMLSKLPNELVLSTERDEHTAFGEGMFNAVKAQLKKGMAIGGKKAVDGSNKFLVKPGPDPSRPQEETEWLSKDELVEECVKPSTNWVITGTGSDGTLTETNSLGRLYLEILSCQDLPNMDVGGAVGNLTDCFVAAVYEDTLVDTTVIDDELSPMWMPWTTRAFVFQMKHPLSPLYIGAFDYDVGLVNGHEGIGRVAINLQNFSPGTTYTLDYKLYSSSNVTERQSFGSITIRLRIDIYNERAYLLAGVLKAPPRFHVNVTKEKNLAVVRYIVNGAYEDEKFDLMVLRSYIGELFEYQALLNYTLGDSMTSLLLWRPQWHFGLVSVPIHSILAFVIAAFLVENPRMIPSFTLYGIAWMMIASMGTRVHHPSPWLRCKSFFNFLEILLRGTCQSETEVAPGEGAEETNRLDAAWKDRRKADAEKSEKLWELQVKLNDIGKEEIHSGTKIKQIDPLAAYLPILLRIQKRLRGVCDSIRRIYCVLRWEDSLLAFGLTFSCLIAGTLLLVLPWEFILYWVCRICVWTFLGPWMKLVDVYVIKHDSKLLLDGDQRKKVKANELKEAMAQFNKQSKVARLRGEEALKNASMRSLWFGNYSAPIPERNVTRHFDYPLSNSMATSRDDTVLTTSWENLSYGNILRGQKLDGVMIPSHAADYKVDEAVTSPDVQRKLKAFEAVALHSVTSKRPTLERHRTSRPVAAVQNQVKVTQENRVHGSPKFELKKSQWSSSMESLYSDFVPTSMKDNSLLSSPRKALKGITSLSSGLKDYDVPKERREAIEEKVTEVDKKDEVDEQGMEIFVTFAGSTDPPLEVATNVYEECDKNSEDYNNSQIAAQQAWTSSPSFKSSDYIDVMFLRK